MATNPPITIGPFANVPAPGSGVKSDWAQQISSYVSERHGLSATHGLHAVANATIVTVSWNAETFDPDNALAPPSNTVNIPAAAAGLWLFQYRGSWAVTSLGALNMVRFTIAGGAYDVATIAQFSGVSVATLGPVPIAANTAVTLGVYQSGGASANLNSGTLHAYRVAP
jgi:hypothetical protein